MGLPERWGGGAVTRGETRDARGKTERGGEEERGRTGEGGRVLPPPTSWDFRDVDTGFPGPVFMRKTPGSSQMDADHPFLLIQAQSPLSCCSQRK